MRSSSHLQVESRGSALVAVLVLSMLGGSSAAKACQGGADAINVLTGVPRRNLGFQSVSADLGDYDSPVEACASDPTEVCQASWIDDLSDEGLSLVYDVDYAEANPTSYVNYAQSLAAYSVAGIVFAVVAVLAGIVALIVRCCCCKGVGVQASDDPDADKELGYPMGQTVCTYASLAFFILIVFSFTITAHVKGNKGFTDAQLALLDAPDATVNLAQGVTSPVLALMTSVIGATGVSVIETLNNTFVVQAQLGTVHEAFICAKEIYDEVTNTTLVATFISVLDDLEGSLLLAPSQVAVDAIILDVTANVTALNSTINAAELLLEQFVGTFTGIDLAALEAQVDAIEISLGNLESDVSAQEASVQLYVDAQSEGALLDATLTPLLVANYVELNVVDFQSKYSDFVTAVGLVPTGASLAAGLTSLNGTLDTVELQLETLLADLLAVEASVASLPTLAALDSSLGDVVSALDDFDLASAATELGSVLSFIVTLPSLGPVLDKIAEIVALQSNIPCIVSVLTVPQDINDNLVELPEDILNATSQFEFLNETITNVTGELEGLVTQFDAFADSFDGTVLDATVLFEAELAGAQALLDSAKATIEALRTQLAAIDPALLDVSPQVAEVTSLIAEVQSPLLRPTAATSAAIEALDPNLAAITLLLGSTLGASFDTDVQAVIDLASVPATFDCVSTATTCWVTATAVDTSCGLGRCEYPFARWTLLRTGLGNFDTALDGVSPDLSAELLPSLTAVGASLSTIDLGCCNDLSALITLQGDLATTSADVDAARSQVDAVAASIEVLSDNFDTTLLDASVFDSAVDGIRAELLAFNVTSLLGGGLDDLDLIFEKEAAVFQLLFTDLAPILDTLREPALNAILASDVGGGVEGLVLHVASQMDAIIGAVEPGQATLVANVEEVLDVVRIIDASRDVDGSNRGVGSMYYIQQMIGAAQDQLNGSSTGGFAEDFPDADFFDAFETPTALGFIEDGRLVDYPGSVKCITDECLRNSIAFYNDESLENVLPEDAGIPMPLSRTQATALPFIIPAFVLIIAFATFFLPTCGYVLACCSVCITPWLFFLIGSLVFPLLIMTADVCASAETVAIAAFAELAPVVCEQVSGTLTPDNFCLFNISVPPLEQEVELDAPELVRSVLASCSGSSTANLADGAAASEPVEALLLSFGVEAALIVETQLAKVLDELLPDVGLVLRPLLRSDVEGASSLLQADIVDFSANINDALGCEKISAAYLGFKDAFCCDFAQAFYWSFASWYLVAFALLFCGLPVGCFAATRLRNLKRSRAQLRAFYAQASARGTVYARAVVGQRADPAEGDAHVVPVAAIAGGEKPPSRRERLNGRLAAMGSSLKDMTGKMRQGRGGLNGKPAESSTISVAEEFDGTPSLAKLDDDLA